MFLAASAQEQPLTPEQRAKKMREAIDKMVEDYERNLQLEDWQSFYADSILTHNLEERNKEMEAMASNKVANYDLYTMVGDKWEEETYNAFRRILTDEQWKKYLKSGAGRAKKARDQRAAKREGTK
jgi:Spy/CpxP family protein refolding chaperone